MNSTACASRAPGSSAEPGTIRAAMASSVAASTGLRKCRTGAPGSDPDMALAPDRDRLELTHRLGDRPLDRQPLHARGADEPDDAGNAVDELLRVLRLGDRPAVAEHDHVRIDRARGAGHRGGPPHALVDGRGR